MRSAALPNAFYSMRLARLDGTARALAHRISDRAYEQLTGIPGAFSTRLLT